jgi:hypothetical protein
VRIGYASAPCGSGKTYQLVKKALSMAANGQVVLFVQPTVELIDKTIREEIGDHPDEPLVRVFHRDSVGSGNKVSVSLANYLRDRENVGQIIFTTHQVLPYVKQWAKKTDIHVLIDEELQVLHNHNHRLPTTHDLITDDIRIVEFDAIYGRVEVINENRIRQKAANRGDDEVLSALQEPLRILNNKDQHSFVNVEQYHKLLSGTAGHLRLHSILQPTLLKGFGSVFMAAANFEDTAVFRLWSQLGVDFRADNEFTGLLRYQFHPNGALVTIYYLTEQNWSKKLRQTLVNGARVQDLAFDAAARLFGEADFVWQANKSEAGSPFGPKGIRLPNAPHGLNTFSHLHDIAFFSALNPPSHQIKFMENRGFTSEEVRASIYYATLYQAAMRISLRNPDDRHPKRIVVPDLGAAMKLRSLLPGAEIEWLESEIPQLSLAKNGGRPREHATNAQRLARQRQNANEQRLNILRDLIDINESQNSTKSDCISNKGGSRADRGIEINTSIGSPPCHGSLFPNIYTSIATGYLSGSDCEWFMLFLSACHERLILSKQDNFLISPAVFDPAKAEGSNRGGANIVSLRHIFLDFEDGDLLPKEIPQLFPHLRMLVTNTFGHTSEKPRFRVVIPTTQIMTVDAHLLVFDGIVSKLEEAGYATDKNKRGRRAKRPNALRSGLDWSKRTASSLFYLPCQAAVPEESFFTYYEQPGREYLDVTVWVENAVAPLQPIYDEQALLGQVIDVNRTYSQTAVNAAILTWQAAPASQGNGAFFNLAVRLRAAGMSNQEIEATLLLQSVFGRSKTERKTQIPSIMKSMNKSLNRTEG